MYDTQKKQLEQIFSALKERNIRSIYFVACGGSMAFFMPAQYILDRECDIPCAVYTANEFIHRSPKAVGSDSLFISCSQGGKTPETVNATAFAREKGALTVSFSTETDSPLWNAAEFGIEYTWGPEFKPSTGNVPILYRLIFGILNIFHADKRYERAIKCIDVIDSVIKRNKELTLEQAKAYGSAYKRESLIYTMSSGACYGVAYSFAICLLMEMLWINTQAIHSGEYFHGPFEITDFDVPFIVILNSGKTRPLDERALRFVNKYSQKVEVIDAKKFDMQGIDKDLEGYFAPIVVNEVLRQYAEQIAEFKGHPLSVRRYMWKMDY